jgi:hypothetical protein
MVATAKVVEVMFESAVEQYEHQQKFLSLVDYEEPDPAKLQNSLNIIHRPIEQHAPILSGWDLTGSEQDIIEESVPLILDTPQNDFVKQRADDMRDLTFWERRGTQSGKKQATELNRLIAQAIKLQGSLFYRDNSTSGYDFISEGQAIMNERQLNTMDRHFVLNDRDIKTFGSDLAARQTLQGRPEDTWKTGQIGANVAEFDLHTSSSMGNLAGGADPATTVTGNQSFAPEGYTYDSATGELANVDYRVATVPVAASASYNVGDKVTFANGGTTVKAVGLADKTDTGQAMTFTIVAKPTGTSVKIYPKPIAADDPGLTALEKAYANVDTRILNLATMNRVNTDASAKVNLFFSSDAVCVLGGQIPADLMSQFAGFKVVSMTMSNGQTMYMVYDGNIADMSFRYRLFTWYGVNVIAPHKCGIAVKF